MCIMSQFLRAASLDGSGSGRLWVTQLGAELLPSPLMQLLAGLCSSSCWPEMSVPYHMGLFIGFLSVFKMQHLAFLKVSVPRERSRVEATLFCNQPSEVVSHPFCCIPLTAHTSPDVEGAPRGMNARSQEGWRLLPSWRLATINWKSFIFSIFFLINTHTHTHTHTHTSYLFASKTDFSVFKRVFIFTYIGSFFFHCKLQTRVLQLLIYSTNSGQNTQCLWHKIENQVNNQDKNLWAYISCPMWV